ncbi:hypothetical protein BRAO375_2560027 [Bradyrhizobium sp. ORS 375]|nr:hypothetical protein BRAO375_2560027 [Bradyrhizobium sp. ORS 375]
MQPTSISADHDSTDVHAHFMLPQTDEQLRRSAELGCGTSVLYAVSPAYVSELLKPRMRYRGISISYNPASGLIGGFKLRDQLRLLRLGRRDVACVVVSDGSRLHQRFRAVGGAPGPRFNHDLAEA